MANCFLKSKELVREYSFFKIVFTNSRKFATKNYPGQATGAIGGIMSLNFHF
jgi:hypothetical protein